MRTLGILAATGLVIAAAGTPRDTSQESASGNGPGSPQAIVIGDKALPAAVGRSPTCLPAAPDALAIIGPVTYRGVCVPTSDYFPLATGNLWIYQGGGIYAGSFLTLEITQTKQFHGVSYFLLHGLPQTDYWLREDDNGSVFEYDTDQAAEKLWWAFQYPLGQSYSTYLPGVCCGVAEVNSRNLPYKGPLGSFDDALEILYPGVFQVGMEREVFLPGVGLALRRQATGGPSYGSWELIYARVGTVTLDSAPELSFGLALDNSIYTVNMMPPVAVPPAAPVMTARIRLRNTAQPITLTYPTGQSFDFEIRDAKGTVMYRWSDGQAFTQVVRTEVFGAGERDYIIRVTLVGPDKNPLPRGQYVAEGWLTTMGAKTFDASVGLEVQWVY